MNGYTKKHNFKLAQHKEHSLSDRLLELAYYEAYSIANKVNIPAGETEHLEEIGADARRAEKNF